MNKAQREYEFLADVQKLLTAEVEDIQKADDLARVLYCVGGYGVKPEGYLFSESGYPDEFLVYQQAVSAINVMKR